MNDLFTDLLSPFCDQNYHRCGPELCLEGASMYFHDECKLVMQ